MLVVSAEAVNQALPVVAVIPLTSAKPGRTVYSTEVFLAAGDTGLSKDSIAMAHQVRTISKRRLAAQCGSIGTPGQRKELRTALRTYLDFL